ncbi:hypothetical protein PYCC9005_002363 [Savitreella phatthalungensis]
MSAAARTTVRLAYQVHGASSAGVSKSPLVVLHGLFGSKSNWGSLSKAFARDLDRDVWTLDARNHGTSPHHPTHNYDVLAADVRDFLHDHDLARRKPILIGHSMGAKICMVLALRHPDLVKLLVPVDNAPLDAAISSDFPKYVRAMREIEAKGVSKQSEADAMLEQVEPALAIRQFLLTNLVRDHDHDDPSSRRMKFRVPLDILAKSLDYMGDFPVRPADGLVYRGPTLFVRGTFSRYVPDDVLPLIGQLFPRFKVEDINAGHWVQAEKPQEFKEVVETWIRDEEEKIAEQGG